MAFEVHIGPPSGPAPVDLQDVFDRMKVAAELSGAAVLRFGEAEREHLRPNTDVWVRYPIIASANRCMLLVLTAKKITVVLNDELGTELKRTPPSVDSAEDLPSDLTTTTELVEHFTADAEEAFEELIRRIGYTIANDFKLFARCVADLLEHLSTDSKDDWRLISFIVKNTQPYKWTFVDSRIEAPAAVIWLLKDLRDLKPATTEELKVEHWLSVAIEKLYEIATGIRATEPSESSGGSMRPDEELLGEAAVRIWEFDKDYRDSRSWFPPSHPWWPFHLPGKPQVIRQHDLPSGPVAHVQFLPWGVDTVAVGMSSGQLLIFTPQNVKPTRSLDSRIFPSSIEYANFGVMVRGPVASHREGEWRSCLILSDQGMSLSGKVITERTPSRDELEQLEYLGRRQRERQLKQLTQCAVPINEGLVPYPDTHPRSLTKSQISSKYSKGERVEYILWRDSDEAILKQAHFNTSFQDHLKSDSSSQRFDLLLGFDPAKSRIVIYSTMLHSQHSFLVPPGITHFDVSEGQRVLALAGNGHLYLYG